MPDLAALGIDRKTVERMYAEWQAGASKSELERRHLSKGESHGKLFTSLVKQGLGLDTEQASPTRQEIQRLREENKQLRAENAGLRQQLGLWEAGGSDT
jgi:hypothetical protein